MTVFVDTNVFVYARDLSEPTKQALAAEWVDHLWTTREGRTSVQVLNELYVTLTRKLTPGLPRAEARADVTDLAAWRPVASSPSLALAAWDIEDRYQLHFWDALVVAAAVAAGAQHLLTEDLQDGQDLGGVVVVDPFRHAPADLA